jgi:hypothetical protein
MNIVMYLALAGGLFAICTFVHFVVDWIFQSHAEAMVKHNNPKVRAKHCLIYTMGFIPLFLLFGFTWYEWLIGANILFWSHFAEDTYIPVFLWAKYMRKPPEMSQVVKTSSTIDGYVHISPPDPKKGFVEFIGTPLGKILMITVDQIIHLMFLWPVVYMAMHHV